MNLIKITYIKKNQHLKNFFLIFYSKIIIIKTKLNFFLKKYLE